MHYIRSQMSTHHLRVLCMHSFALHYKLSLPLTPFATVLHSLPPISSFKKIKKIASVMVKNMSAIYLGLVLTSLWFQQLVHSGSVGLNFEEATNYGTAGRLVRKEERTPIVSTEFGAISAADIPDGTGKHRFHLQFITLEPNSLFLPVLLHADMVFYVHTGSGRLSWTDSDELKKVKLQRGDVYRLKSGSLFFLHSSLEPERPRFRVIAMFANPEDEELEDPSIGPYSSIGDLVRGFDKKILQAAFQVPEELIEEITSAIDTPAIVHAATERKKKFWEEDNLLVNTFLSIKRYNMETAENKKKHKETKTFNFYKEDPDFENCKGWSTVVTKHNLHALHGSHVGVFMVNLTKGSMMGPHWNPMATEVSVVLEGEGMVRVVCSSTLTSKDCKNTRFRVEEGDVFAVPRFHPMSQTSFNNGSLVFMGFTTTTKKNHPQFLAGKASVLRTLDRLVLGASFSVSNTTIDKLLAAQEESIILDCTSCAEEQEIMMEKEADEETRKEKERKEEEEEARRREEEEKSREERKRREEERKRREEEEKRRQEEEEERQQREEEKRRQEEEERHQREEEQRRQEEEERHQKEQRRREEEEERQHEEEEQRRQQEEEERRREEEEEERHQREEEQRRQEEEERHQKEQRRREEEEERQHEEEEQRRQQEEEERRREEEEIERRRQEEEGQEKREEEQRREQEQEEEEEHRRQQEEEEEEHRRQEEEEEEQEEKRRRQEEEERQQREEGEEEEVDERQQEDQRQREQERQREEWRRQQEEQQRRRRQEEEEGSGEQEESEAEAARREEEERFEWERKAEEAARRRRGRNFDQRNGEGRRILQNAF